MNLTVAPGVLDDLVRHARACLPEEACGFLAGRRGVAERFIPARNVLRSDRAFEVDPSALFGLFRELRASGEDLVAICHSHPRGPAVPSERDVASAHYPESAHVIVSLAGPDPETRAYRIVEGAVTEIELHAMV